MTLEITTQQIQQAEQALVQGGAASFWQYLASQGDTYAAKAHSIITSPSGFFGQIVTQSWISTGADLSKFPDVAETYASNYLVQVKAKNGVLPDAGQIETAYRNALEFNHVPAEAAIDSTMHVKVWTSFLGMEPSRQTGDTAYPDRALLDQVMQFARAGLATATGEHSYFYDKNAGHWYYELKDPNGNSIGFENASPDIECRLSWWVRAGKCSALGSLVTDLQSSFHTAEITTSPLTLDLDGDGVETISKSAGVHFDHDGNHFLETTGWVGKDDGLLVLDRNGNGKIDNGGELFGNNTRLASGNKAANGFVALAELDSNRDGKIDANDAAFNQLRVWKDSDGNGVVSDGELLTLNAVGVQSLSTAYTTQNQTDAQGNQHLQAGQYTRADGSSRALTDVWFAADTARTVDQEIVEVSDAIAALPDLQGFGSVHSLHQAMARDTSGRLQALVTSFANEANADTRAALMKTILYAWVGVENIDPNSRAATQIYGNAIGDARKLATLEAFLGEDYLGTWCWGARDPKPPREIPRLCRGGSRSLTFTGVHQ